MEENSESQVFNYKNVQIPIVRYNEVPYVDCRAISRSLKRCISMWVKDNKTKIAMYCHGNGLKVNKAIIANRWLLKDIALMYAESVSNDFYEALKRMISDFNNESSTKNDKSMNQLTKSSSSEEIKMYFNAILRLAKASDEYPVNLDEVWPLVYGRKEEAVRALTSENSEFIQSVDYQILRKDAEKTQSGRPANEYFLTVSCLEFFIARKVRAVFDVYRKVFHKSVEATKQLKSATVKDKIAVADWLTGFLNLNDSSKLALAKTIAEPLGLPTPDYTPSKGVLKSAGELLKENAVSVSAQIFNQMMIEKGYMIERTRPSSNGGTKKFKSITGEGLGFGENQVNPNNPKSTQPLYYEDKFIELLVLLQLKLTA